MTGQIVDANVTGVIVSQISPQYSSSAPYPIQAAMANWLKIVEAISASLDTDSKINIIDKEKTLVFDMRLTILEDDCKQLYDKLPVFRDITEQHQTEHAIGERVKELKSIYDLSY